MSCDLGLVCAIVIGIPFILLLGIVGGHFLVRGISSIRRNAFAVIFLVGYGLGMSLLPAIIISALHFHIHPNRLLHLHSPSEILLHLGSISIDRGTFFLALLVILVFVASLQINQLTMWRHYSKLRTSSQPNLAKELKERLNLPRFGDVELLIIENANPEAYSFSLIKFETFFIPFRFRNVVVITTGLMDLLPMRELETVIAHECAHIRSLDTIFLPFLSTISSILFFDLILRSVRNRITASREFLADKTAAYATGKPLDLARSLFRMLDFNYSNSSKPHAVSLFNRNSEAIVIRRINQLIMLSETIGA